MLKYRVASGLLLIAANILIFWLDGRMEGVALTGFWRDLFGGRPLLPPGFVLLLTGLVLIPIAGGELRAMFRARGVDTAAWLINAAAACIMLAFYFAPDTANVVSGMAALAGALIVTVTASMAWHVRRAQIEGAAAAAGTTLLAVAYLGILSAFFLAMRRDHSAWVVLGILLVTKASDIGAYAAGKTLGRHKLIPFLSPGKTWEGLVGGVLASVLLAVAFAYLTQKWPSITQVHRDGVLMTVSYSPVMAAWAGAVIALVGVVGGMMMSLLKREAGIKDSGHLIPGMGGILDVLDSPLLVAPVAYWILKIGS